MDSGVRPSIDSVKVVGPRYIPAKVDPAGTRAQRRASKASARQKRKKLTKALAKAGVPLTYDQRTVTRD